MADLTILIGAKHEEKILVTNEVAIDFLGLDGPRVLSTPSMIMWMEKTSRNLLMQYLEKGYDSLGTEVNIKHLAASPMGMSVTFRAEVLAVNERRVTFRVEAQDEKEKIGEGTHERTIINVARFAARLAAKNA
jgi:fluoroacetyl-CoA thioesterase